MPGLREGADLVVRADLGGIMTYDDFAICYIITTYEQAILMICNNSLNGYSERWYHGNSYLTIALLLHMIESSKYAHSFPACPAM